ncbi:hypothetical protein [Clostridium vitabionis]|jgi:hypothetical protein|uniref:hypothetical protein n=1 Tax=Clostridium vitabionis TaxID=2784388 RepID=UPI00188CFF62|nr:hypothetical protein [Clostridium vitabionis]
MGIFSRNQGEKHNNITSVVLIEQTQKYKNKTSWGLSFSNSAFGDPIAMSQTVPDGTELTFSITYKNGRKKILKVMSGTAVADRLLQMSLDPDKRNASADRVEGKSGQNAASAEGKPLIKLGKNQLPQGRYIIGKDLPEGPLISRGYGAKDIFLCTRPMKIQHWGIISILRMSVLHMNINIASACICNVQQAIC